MGGPIKGRADFLLLGDYNIACSMCGRKRKFSELVKNWQGLYRCPEHNEPRQPQDFARNVKDVMTVPWAQPQTDLYVGPSITPTFPGSIFPSPVQLSLGSIDFITETTDNIFTTETGIEFATESSYTGSAGVILPNWVIPETYTWTWQSGGAGILISSPNENPTGFETLSAGNNGIAQCVVTDSRGGQAIFTVEVSS